jgi:hypothetical protein
MDRRKYFLLLYWQKQSQVHQIADLPMPFLCSVAGHPLARYDSSCDLFHGDATTHEADFFRGDE